MHPVPDAPLRLGTRRSPFALAQASETRTRLCTAHGWPAEAVALAASGDKIQELPVGRNRRQGAVDQEPDARLLAGEIDCAVLCTDRAALGSLEPQSS